MGSRSDWMIVVVYSEWLQWVATGGLRCHIERVRRIAGPDDLTGFRKLLDAAPYLNRSDQSGFIVAQLVGDWRASATVPEGADSPSLLWIDLSGVSQFFPLSERAGRLLQADVERSSCPLGAPVLEPLWRQWMDEQDSVTADRSATSFTRAYGLIPGAELAPIQRLRADLELIRADPIKAEGRKRYEATRAFPWAEALALFRLNLSDADFQKLDQAQLKKVVHERASDSKLNGGILRLEPNRQQADELGAHLPATPQQFRQWLVVSHYQHLIKLERALDPVEIAQDLSWLVDEHGDTALATQAAYLIGLDTPEEFSTALYCAARPSQFPCLKPRGLPGNIDVPELARQRRPLPVPPPVPEPTTPEPTTAEPTTSDSISADAVPPVQTHRGTTKTPAPAQSTMQFADEAATLDSEATKSSGAAADSTTPEVEPKALATAPAAANPDPDAAPEPASSSSGNPT